MGRAGHGIGEKIFNNQSVARKKRRVTRSVGYTEESFAKWKIKTSEPSNTTAVMDCHFVRPRVGGNNEQHEKKERPQIQKALGKSGKKGDGNQEEKRGRGVNALMLAYSPRRLPSIRLVLRVSIDLGIRVRRQVGCDLQEAGLDQEVPHAARLVDVYLDQVSGFPPTELATSPSVLPHERFLDH